MQLSKPARGTFLVDSCSLIDLTAEIPHTMQADGYDPSKHFLDGLLMLAEQGYRVLIPESVMYETTGQLLGKNRKLRNVNDYFDKGHDRPKRRLIDHIGEVLTPFFERVAKGEIPGIEILPTGNTPGVSATHIRGMKAILKKHPHPSDEARHEIINLNRERPEQMADRIEARNINSLLKTPNLDYPLILLSNDKKFLKKEFLEHVGDAHMHLLNVTGLVAALNQSGIFRETMAMKPNLATQDIIDVMEEFFKERYPAAHRSMPKMVDSNLASDDKGQIIKDRPFLQDMQLLARELAGELPYTDHVDRSHSSKFSSLQSAGGHQGRAQDGKPSTITRT